MCKKKLEEIIEQKRMDIYCYTTKRLADLWEECLKIDQETVLEVVRKNPKITDILSERFDYYPEVKDQIAVLREDPIGVGIPPFMVIISELMGFDIKKNEDIIAMAFMAKMAKDHVITSWVNKNAA